MSRCVPQGLTESASSMALGKHLQSEFFVFSAYDNFFVHVQINKLSTPFIDIVANDK
jgi:hypothetical protein